LTERLTPVRVLGGHLFRQVDADESRGFNTCGVTTADRAFCWGYNGSGALGDGTSTIRLVPAAVKGGLQWRQVAVSGFHTCAVTQANRAYCWGWNNFGQLGNGSTLVYNPTPSAVASPRQFRQISVGGDATCAVTASDLAFCWGHGLYGQLGDGTMKLTRVPRAVAGGLSFTRVSVSFSHTCGETKSNRAAYCWGNNSNGQLGDGTTTFRLAPVPVAGGLSFAQVSAGHGHTCGKTAGSVGYCWGYNGSGALGDGTTDSSLVPVRVAGPM